MPTRSSFLQHCHLVAAAHGSGRSHAAFHAPRCVLRNHRGSTHMLIQSRLLEQSLYYRTPGSCSAVSAVRHEQHKVCDSSCQLLLLLYHTQLVCHCWAKTCQKRNTKAHQSLRLMHVHRGSIVGAMCSTTYISQALDELGKP